MNDLIVESCYKIGDCVVEKMAQNQDISIYKDSSGDDDRVFIVKNGKVLFVLASEIRGDEGQYSAIEILE